MEEHIVKSCVADKHGVDGALIIQHVAYWIRRNLKNNKNIHDGYAWTYNSCFAYKDIFSFWSEDQIYRKLKKLEDAGVIKTGNYNDSKYDRKKWYTIVDEWILELYRIDFAKLRNEDCENAEPIANYKTQTSKPDLKNIKKEKEGHVKRVYDNYPTKCVITNRTLGKSSKDKDKIERLLKKHTVDELIEIQELYTKSCKRDNVYMKNYSTFLNNLPDKEQYKQEEKKEKVFDSVEYRKKLKEESERNAKARESDDDTRTSEEIMADMKKCLMEQNKRKYGA